MVGDATFIITFRHIINITVIIVKKRFFIAGLCYFLYLMLEGYLYFISTKKACPLV